jgi:hypothetical protein
MRKHLTASENAKARFAKREAIMAPRKPIHLTRFGWLMAGFCAGALFAGLVGFVMDVSGTLSGLAVIVGTGITLAIIGVNIEGVDE